MLALRPNCECCDRNLPPDSPHAAICTFECPFCSDCATTVFDGSCPNCGGEPVRRPIRPVNALDRFPASIERVLSSAPQCTGRRSSEKARAT